MPASFRALDAAIAKTLREGRMTPEEAVARIANATTVSMHNPNWREDLRLSREGELMATFTTLVEIFSEHSFWQDPETEARADPMTIARS